MRILPGGSFWETIGKLATKNYKTRTSRDEAEKMRIVTKKEKIKNVAKEWKKQYCRGKNWIYGEGKKEIYERLIKEKPQTEEEVIQIIGNNSWTENICEACERDVEILVELSNFLDEWDTNVFFICEDCLRKALALIEKYKSKQK